MGECIVGCFVQEGARISNDYEMKAEKCIR